MPQSAAHCGKRNTSVAAGGLDDGVAGTDATFPIGFAQDMQRHPVLDAAGEVHLLAFGVDGALAAARLVFDRQERRVADEPLKGLEARGGCWFAAGSYRHIRCSFKDDLS